MSRRIDSLLQDAGRLREVLIEWVCALISGAVTALLVWLLYLVAWRNPHEYGVNDLFKISTFGIFGLLLAIAVGFSVIAFRLINRRRRERGLMSPLLLRIWASFFGLGGAAMLIDAILKKRWTDIPHYWILFSATLSMACAAFVLARKRERRERNEKSRSRQAGPSNESQPFRSE